MIESGYKCVEEDYINYNLNTNYKAKLSSGLQTF